MEIYSAKDLQTILNNLEDIQHKSSIAKLKHVEPNLEERKKVIESILEFIKKKQLIIYGGFAMHFYLNETIYDMESNVPDIDIYSSDPVNDIIELTNSIKVMYPDLNIISKEAFHKDTFSLYVNYINYLDITYTPEKVLNHLKIKKYKEFNLIHPSLIILDLFRQFNDPLISYWRLEKSFYRFHLLNKKYNLLQYFKDDKIDIHKEDLQYLDENIFKKVKKLLDKKKTEILFCGFYCYRLFSNKKYNKIPYFEIFSLNYNKDVKYFYERLKSMFKNIRMVEYYPFFQYINKNTVFYDENNKLILIVYDNNDKCIPYITSNNNERFVSYLYLIQFTFSLYIYYGYINKKNKMDFMKKIIFNMIILKNNYFKNNKNKNVLDKSIFQQFIIDCKGNTFLTHIEFFKNLQNKKLKDKFKRFNYTPSTQNINRKKLKYFYQNIDGLVKNQKS